MEETAVFERVTNFIYYSVMQEQNAAQYRNQWSGQRIGLSLRALRLKGLAMALFSLQWLGLAEDVQTLEPGQIKALERDFMAWAESVIVGPEQIPYEHVKKYIEQWLVSYERRSNIQYVDTRDRGFR